MSDVTEQRMCDEPFGSDEEGEEADVESYLEDNSSELMDRLRELEVQILYSSISLYRYLHVHTDDLWEGGVDQPPHARSALTFTTAKFSCLKGFFLHI